MGQIKRYWEEWDERGCAPPAGHFVCADCVSNEMLQDLIRSESIDQPCTYCDSESSAPIEVLLEEICDAAFAGYTDPAHELSYDSDSGGYLGQVFDAFELVGDLESWTEVEELENDVVDAFSIQEWCRRDHSRLSPEDRLHYGWSDFVNQVVHKTRYLFLQETAGSDPDDVPPGGMLDEVGKLLSALLETFTMDGVVYRARVVKPDSPPSSPEDLGPPPASMALLENRMSPAGIPMFYAAEDPYTAALETYDPEFESDHIIVIGEWRPKRDLLLLDLTRLPEAPDPFDENKRRLAPSIRFMHAFVHQLTKPVSRKSSSIDYVPTQIVTEYIRRRMQTKDGTSFDGIRYRSSKRDGGVSVVLFAEQGNCVGKPSSLGFGAQQLLELVSSQHLDPAEVCSADS